MVELGYFAAHEQRNPKELLSYAVQAERQGFDSVWSSDHFHPWSHTGASSGFAWSWLGAAAAMTSRIKLGTGVTAPTLRYHPAVVAQCFSTLNYMFPGRIFLGLGTGEAMNEVPLGLGWPPFHERLRRLEEAVRIIRLLWTGEWIDFKGVYYELRQARLYTKPESHVPIYVAACGPRTAKVAGRYADGLLTLPMPKEAYTTRLFPAVEAAAKESGRDPRSIRRIIELEVSYDEDYDRAMASCRFWSGTKLPDCLSIADPRELEERGKSVPDEKLRESWLVFTEADELIKVIEDYVRLGFDYVVFLSSSPDEEKFLRLMGRRVIPYVRENLS